MSEGASRIDVADWLRGLGLHEYGSRFAENHISADLLPSLTAEDLKDLGVVSIGHRRRLLEAIAALRSAPKPEPHQRKEAEPERRQLTVMFCDLVGSTELSGRLDPEDLRAVIGAYHRCCAETVGNAGGFVAKYMGDGVLAYFGYPEAHEDDTERAVRAGLDLVHAVRALQAAPPLQTRIGIATGLVVVGEVIGEGAAQEQAVVGETPNLAARLQALAEPGVVVIAESTRRQIGALFELADRGALSLKGFADPQRVWQVISEDRSVNRFEALRSRASPLIGRHQELEVLLRGWAEAQAGSGRVVLISGEPGVGKSRMADALAERVADGPQIPLRYFCSPYHQDSALYPIIGQMEHAAGFKREDSPVEKLARLQALLAATDSSAEDVALFAELLALPADGIAPSRNWAPHDKRRKLLQALLRDIERRSLRDPVLLLFEDIHWIDPSTHELLDCIIKGAAAWPVLVLATFRPEFEPPWTGHPHVMTLDLPRLDRRDTAAMVGAIAGVNGSGQAALPTEIVHEIAERTDGVPLFIEELTKAVLEAGIHSSVLPSSPPPAFSVPPTLHASLMARLDRLGPVVREVAQTGAAIGREFEQRLLALIVDTPERQLDAALARLVDSGLLFVQGTRAESVYTFKHALVQDAAYSTLLRSRRRQLHSRIAAVLEDRYPDTASSQPALLARHYTEAGLSEKAISYRLKAGQFLLARSAMAEAAAELRKGLDMLGSLPDNLQHQQHEFELLSALGSALSATKGWSAPEVSETFGRARAVAEQIERPDYLVPLIMGQYTFHLVRAEHRLAFALAEQLENIGETRNNAIAQWLGLSSQGTTCFLLGELAAARDRLERFYRLAGRVNHVIPGLSFDPYALTLTWLGLSLAYLGYIDQGRARMEEALLEARRLKHAHTLAHVLLFTNWLDWIVGSPMKRVEDVLALTTEHGFPHYHGWALAYRGWAFLAEGRASEGVVPLTQGLAELRATANVVSTPMVLAWLAHAHALLGEPAEEAHYFDEVAQVIEATEERVSMAELLYRVRGDLLRATGERVAAEANYRQALAIAQQQGAKLLELRAATSLGQLWCENGDHAGARELLTPIYDWFTEGFDTPALTEARVLLANLNRGSDRASPSGRRNFNVIGRTT